MILVHDERGVHLADRDGLRTYKFSNVDAGTSHVNFIAEIPKSHTVKNELFYDPDGMERIRPDMIDGTARIVLPVPYTYGFIPSTYSPPSQKDPWLGLPGDGDCLDAFFLSSSIQEIGSKQSGTPVAALECDDAGEADWKIVIAGEGIDPEATDLATGEIVKWLATYKATPVITRKVHRDDHTISQVIQYHIASKKPFAP